MFSPAAGRRISSGCGTGWIVLTGFTPAGWKWKARRGGEAEKEGTREGRAAGACREDEGEEGDVEESELTVDDFLDKVGRIASCFEGFATFEALVDKALEGDGEGVT